MNIREIIDIAVPPLEETQKMMSSNYDLQYQNERLMVDGKITEEYNFWQTAYKIIVQQYLLGVTSLQLIDERLWNHDLQFQVNTSQSYYQKYDTMDLKYIYMRNMVHIERLSKEEFEILEEYVHTERNTESLKNMIVSTYKKILAKDVMPHIYVAYFPDIYGRGNFPGDAIVFEISVKRDLYAEVDDEHIIIRKYNILQSIQTQLETILSARLKVTTRIMIDY